MDRIKFQKLEAREARGNAIIQKMQVLPGACSVQLKKKTSAPMWGMAMSDYEKTARKSERKGKRTGTMLSYHYHGYRSAQTVTGRF